MSRQAKPPSRRHFLRQWREHRGMTLVEAADDAGITHGQLSRIERGEQPYNQGLLENLSLLYRCEPVDLLASDPRHPARLETLLRHASEAERKQITALAETVLGFRQQD